MSKSTKKQSDSAIRDQICKAMHVEGTDKAIDLISKNNQDPNDYLYYAMSTGKLEMAAELAKLGARHDYKYEHGATAFEEAERLGCVEALWWLILSDVKVCLSDIADKNGNTILHRAVQKGDKEMVKMLIDVLALVNVQNNNGDTPMHIAARAGNEEIIKELYKTSDSSRGILTDSVNIFLRNKAGEKAKDLIPKEVLEEIIPNNLSSKSKSEESITDAELTSYVQLISTESSLEEVDKDLSGDSIQENIEDDGHWGFSAD